jgi:hypothetical protein
MSREERVRITIDFKRPSNHSLEDCCKLVMNQMRATPEWDEPAGTGALNYVCHDSSLEAVSANFYEKSRS